MADAAKKLNPDELWLVDTVTGKAYTLFDGFRIGRAEGDLQLSGDGAVSSRHCVFYLNGSVLELEDVGSRNGTMVGGKKIEPKMRLALLPGVKLEIGNNSFVIQAGGEAPKARATAVELASLCSQIAPDNIPTRAPGAWSSAGVPKSSARAGDNITAQPTSSPRGGHRASVTRTIASPRPSSSGAGTEKKSDSKSSILIVVGILVIVAAAVYFIPRRAAPLAPPQASEFNSNLNRISVTLKKMERDYKTAVQATKSGALPQDEFLKTLRATFIPAANTAMKELEAVEPGNEAERTAKGKQMEFIRLWGDQLGELALLLETKDNSHLAKLEELQKQMAVVNGELDKAVAGLRNPASN